MQTQLARLAPAKRAEYEEQIADVQNLMHEYAHRYTREAPDLLRARILADFDSRVRQNRTEPRGRRRPVAVVSIAAASIAIAIGAGAIIGRSTAPAPAPAPAPATTAQADAAAAVFSAPDAVLSTATLADARGTLNIVSSRSLNRAVATVRGTADPLPDDSTLQLWMVDGRQQPESAGLLDASAVGPLVVDGLGGTRALAVTLEPRGGSSSPTLPLLGQVKI